MTNPAESGGLAPAGVADPGDAGSALLRGGTVPALILGVAGTAVSAAWGVRGAVGFAVGTALAVASLAVGPILLRASRHASPPAVTAVAVGGYAGVVVVLGVVFVLLGPSSWLSAGHLAAALVAVTVAGLVGQTRAVTRLRVLTFGSAQVGPLQDASAGPDGDAAQSSPQTGR